MPPEDRGFGLQKKKEREKKIKNKMTTFCWFDDDFVLQKRPHCVHF